MHCKSNHSQRKVQDFGVPAIVMVAHDIDSKYIKIVNVESNAFKRRVKEAIYIKVNNPLEIKM